MVRSSRAYRPLAYAADVGANAIHGIVLLAPCSRWLRDTPLLKGLAFVAVVLVAANVFGGFA